MPIIDRRNPESIRLGKHLRSVGDARWARDYLEAARLLVGHLGLDADDLRLNMSVPKSFTTWLLPVTINNRYVLAIQRNGADRVVGAIWGTEFRHIPHLRQRAVHIGRFDALRGEDALDPPCFVRFRDPRILIEDDEVREGWLAAARRELERASTSPYRRFHSHTVFRMVTEAEARERLLAEVWG